MYIMKKKISVSLKISQFFIVIATVCQRLQTRVSYLTFMGLLQQLFATF